MPDLSAEQFKAFLAGGLNLQEPEGELSREEFVAKTKPADWSLLPLYNTPLEVQRHAASMGIPEMTLVNVERARPKTDQETGRLLNDFVMSNLRAYHAFTDEEKDKQRLMARTIAAVNTTGPSSQEWAEATKAIWSRFLADNAARVPGGREQVDFLQTLSADEVDQVLNWRAADPPQRVARARRVLTVDLWGQASNLMKGLQTQVVSGRRAKMGLQGSGRIALQEFAPFEAALNPDVARTRAQQQVHLESQYEIQRTQAALARVGRTMTPEDVRAVMEKFAPVPHRVYIPGIGQVPTAEAAKVGLQSALMGTMAFSPLLGAAFLGGYVLTDEAMGQLGVSQLVRNFFDDWGSESFLVYTGDRKRAIAYMAERDAAIDSLPVTDDVKKELRRTMWGLRPVFTQHLVEYRGRDPGYESSLLRGLGTAGRELFTSGVEMATDPAGALLMLGAPRVLRKAFPRAGPKATAERLLADWIRKPNRTREQLAKRLHDRVNNLGSDASRQDFLKGVRNRIGELDVLDGKTQAGLFGLLNRLEKTDFIARGVADPTVKTILRDLQQTIRETPRTITEQVFGLHEPGILKGNDALWAVAAEEELLARAQQGQKVSALRGGELSQETLDAIARGFSGPQIDLARARVQIKGTVEAAELQLRRAQDKMFRQMLDDGVGLNLFTERAADLQAALKDASEAAAGRHEGLSIELSGIGRDLDMLAAAFRHRQMLRPLSVVNQLAEQLNVRLTDRPPPEWARDPLTSEWAEAYLGKLSTRAKKTSQALKEISGDLATLERLRTQKTQRGAVFSEKEMKTLRRYADAAGFVRVTNFREAARRVLEVDTEYVPMPRLQDVVEVPKSVTELEAAAAKDLFSRSRERLRTERAFLEKKILAYRLRDLRELPIQERHRAVVEAVKTDAIVRAVGEAKLDILLQHYDGLPLASRKAIFEAIRSGDMELVAQAFETAGVNEARGFREKLYGECLELLEQFGVINEPEYARLQRRTGSYVKYLYTDTELLHMRARRPLAGKRALDVDPDSIRPRIPEDHDLLISRAEGGEPVYTKVNSLAEAEAWLAEHPEMVEAGFIERWPAADRNIHGLIRDVAVADAEAVRDIHTAIGRRVIATVLREAKLAVSEADMLRKPELQRRQYIKVAVKERPGMRHFRDLDGQWIHRDVAAELARYEVEQSGMWDLLNSHMAWYESAGFTKSRKVQNFLRKMPTWGRAGQAVYSVWKFARILASPPVWLRNDIANFWFMWFGGHNMSPVGIFQALAAKHRFLRLRHDPVAAAADPYYRVLVENGMVGPGLIERPKIKLERREWGSLENKMTLLEEARAIAARAKTEGNVELQTKAEARIQKLELDAAELSRGIRAAHHDFNNRLSTLYERMGDRYNAIDGSAKYALVRYLMRRGLTAQEAVAQCRTFLQDYSLVPGGVRFLGRSIFTPVPSFTYNAFRILGNMFTRQPLRLLRLFSSLLAWNASSLTMQGISPEEALSMIDAKRKQRHSGGLWDLLDLATHIFLPIPGMYGAHINVADLMGFSMFTPEAFSSRGLWAAMSPEERQSNWAQFVGRFVAGPVMSYVQGPGSQIIGSLVSQRDQGTGRPLKSSRGFAATVWNNVKMIGKQFFPAWTPGSYHYEWGRDFIEQKPQRFTLQPRSLGNVVATLTGIPARHYTAEQLAGFAVFQNAEEDGKLDYAIEVEDARMKELKEEFHELTIPEQARRLYAYFDKEEVDATGRRVGIPPRKIAQSVLAKLKSLNRAGALNTYMRLSPRAKAQTIVDLYRMGLPPERAAPFLAVWFSASMAERLERDEQLRAHVAALGQVVEKDWLRRAVVEARRIQAQR